MNDSILSVLACPVCGSRMKQRDAGRVLYCDGVRSHCYDVARSGYVNLTRPGEGEGDLAEAVRARSLFLRAGYYQKLSDAIDEILSARNASLVVDAGCGEGYYTNRMAVSRDVLGVDLSRAGVDAAAKLAKQCGARAAFAVGSIFSLPVQSGTIDAVTNLFAPCAEEEFARVLKPNGCLILVGAGERHLLGLKERIYSDPYLNPGRADLPTHMRLLERSKLTYRICVEGNEDVKALFSMTPYYWRTSQADRAKLDDCDTLETDVDFDIFLYEKEE